MLQFCFRLISQGINIKHHQWNEQKLYQNEKDRISDNLKKDDIQMISKMLHFMLYRAKRHLKIIIY